VRGAARKDASREIPRRRSPEFAAVNASGTYRFDVSSIMDERRLVESSFGSGSIRY